MTLTKREKELYKIGKGKIEKMGTLGRREQSLGRT